MRKKPSPPVESVHRALQLVLALQEGQILGVKQAAALLGVAPSTAHRLLNALCYDEFAQQGSDRRYRPGLALFSCSRDRPYESRLRRLVRPALATLNAVLHESIQLWVLQGAQVRQIDSIGSSAFIRAHVETCDAFPAHCSAAGKAILAALDSSSLDALDTGRLPGEQSARVKTRGDLRRHLAGVRQNGYALNIEEAVPGISGVGVCVRDQHGVPIVGISVVLPAARFEPRRILEYAGALHQAAADAQKALSTH